MICFLLIGIIAVGTVCYKLRSFCKQSPWTGERPAVGSVIQVYGAWSMETKRQVVEHTIVWCYAGGEESERKVIRTLQLYGGEKPYSSLDGLVGSAVVVLRSGDNPAGLFLKKM